MGDALDLSDLRRMRMFHAFGIVAPLLGIALTIPLGGDPFARHLFWGGLVLLAATNVVNVWCASDPRRWSSPYRDLLWPIAGLGALAPIYYFGPFSAAVMALLIGCMFVALGSRKAISHTVLGMSVVGHVLIALPIITRWRADVGLFDTLAITVTQQVIAEILIVALLLSGYALARWARLMAGTALADLESARRVIGDQQQALAEVEDLERANRGNAGRWSGQMIGAWRLGSVIGRGAMGEVYEGEDGGGRTAAVKVLTAAAGADRTLVERFHREIQIAASLKSSHIVRVLDISPATADVPYLAMERLVGTDLAAILRARNRMPFLELIGMLDQIAKGLEVARFAGVVHRDLKPSNLFLHDTTAWKILDFGVARVTGTSDTLTREKLIGTPRYMAPEQAAGLEVTCLADVYALGAITYRCLTGRAPFQAEDLAGLVYQVVHVPPVRPSLFGRVPTNVEEILAVAMAKDPRRRFASALEFVRHLFAARDGRALPLEPPHDAWADALLS